MRQKPITTSFSEILYEFETVYIKYCTIVVGDVILWSEVQQYVVEGLNGRYGNAE